MRSGSAEASPVRTRSHLWAGLIALLVLAAALSAGRTWATALERRSFRALLTDLTNPRNRGEDDIRGIESIDQLKNQGLVMQQRAFERSDQFLLYGSSELVKAIPDKSSYFFRDCPTGFSILPVGKAGSTPLIILQRLAALGGVTHGRPVAIIISPSWFFIGASEGDYAGNYSHQQALAALLNPRLSLALRTDLARQLLLHRATLEQDNLLHFECVRMARGTTLDYAVLGLVWPLARLERALQALQDHFEVALYIKVTSSHHPNRPPPPPPAAPPDWERLIADASTHAVYFKRPDKASLNEELEAARVRIFHEKFQESPEWVNFDLLVRGLHEMGLRPLILCVPPDGHHLEQGGVPKEMLTEFTARLRTVGSRYGATVETFDDHIDDTPFHADNHDHLSTRGWMYFNQTLDRFYHANPPSRPPHIVASRQN